MIEAAFVFDKEGKVIHWHLPIGRTVGSIPDSRDLWSVLWENRKNLGGVAHTHPWNGCPEPSGTDLTTFAACEDALGIRLVWPIVTFDQVKCFAFQGPNRYNYNVVERFPELHDNDLDELRRLSGKQQNGLFLTELRKLGENIPKRVRTGQPVSRERFLEKIKADLRHRASCGGRTYRFETYDGECWGAVKYAAEWLLNEGFETHHRYIDKKPDDSDCEYGQTEFQYASLEVRW